MARVGARLGFHQRLQLYERRFRLSSGSGAEIRHEGLRFGAVTDAGRHDHPWQPSTAHHEGHQGRHSTRQRSQAAIFEQLSEVYEC